MRPRAYAFRVHALDGGWTIRRYFPRVVNCRVAFSARRLSTFTVTKEKPRREVYFEDFEGIARKPFRSIRKSIRAKRRAERRNLTIERGHKFFTKKI